MTKKMQRFRLKNQVLFKPREFTFQDETLKVIAMSQTQSGSETDQEEREDEDETRRAHNNNDTDIKKEKNHNIKEKEPTIPTPKLSEGCLDSNQLDKSCYLLPPYDCRSAEFLESMHLLVDLILQQA